MDKDDPSLNTSKTEVFPDIEANCLIDKLLPIFTMFNTLNVSKFISFFMPKHETTPLDSRIMLLSDKVEPSVNESKIDAEPAESPPMYIKFLKLKLEESDAKCRQLHALLNDDFTKGAILNFEPNAIKDLNEIVLPKFAKLINETGKFSLPALNDDLKLKLDPKYACSSSDILLLMRNGLPKMLTDEEMRDTCLKLTEEPKPTKFNTLKPE
jgi:hypothetical protein